LGCFARHSAQPLFGIDAYLVETEVDVVPAFKGQFTGVGLPDIAVKVVLEFVTD